MVVTAQEIIKQMMYAEHSNRAGKKNTKFVVCVPVCLWAVGNLEDCSVVFFSVLRSRSHGFDITKQICVS